MKINLRTITFAVLALAATAARAQDLTGTLNPSGVTAGSCGDATHSCSLTIDTKGRITAQSNVAIAAGGGAPGGSSGDVQVNNAGSFGGITLGDGQILIGQPGGALPDPHTVSGGDGSISDTGLMSVTGTGGLPFKSCAASVDCTNPSNLTTPGTLPDAALSNIITSGGPLGSSTTVPQVTWDSHGRITAINSVAISGITEPVLLSNGATQWYPLWNGSTPVTGGSGRVSASWYCLPLEVRTDVHVTGLAATVTTVGGTGGQSILALYQDTIDTSGSRTGLHSPGAHLVDTGAVSDTTGGTVTASVSSTFLATGMYWGCVQSNDATVRFLTPAAGDEHVASLIGSATAANALSSSATVKSLSTSGTFGTVPSSFANSGAGNLSESTGLVAAVMAVKVASVP